MRGRPKLPDGEAMDEIITLRIRPGERKLFESIATAAGVSLSDWARSAMIDAAESVKLAARKNGPCWRLVEIDGEQFLDVPNPVRLCLLARLKAFIESVLAAAAPGVKS